MFQELNEIKNEFSFSCKERVILAISALKLGHQAFMNDLRNARRVGNISQRQYRLHSRWYCEQIKRFNSQLNELGKITESKVFPLEKQVRQIIVTGISLSADRN